MKRLAVFYLTLSVGLAAVIALNAFLTFREAAVVEEFLESAPARAGAGGETGEGNVKILVNYEQEQRRLTMKILDSDRSSEIFVFGSSHCYLFEDRSFSAPFLNLSVTSGSVMDFAAFTRRLLARTNKPRLVLIGADYWTVCPSIFRSDAYGFDYLAAYISFVSKTEGTYSGCLDFAGQVSRTLRAAFTYELLRRRMAEPPFIAGLSFFTACRPSDIGYDARRRIYKNPKVYEATDEYRIKEARAHFESVKKEFAANPPLDAGALRTFSSVLGELKKAGTAVIVFAPPFSFDEFELYKNDKKIFGRVTEFYSAIRGACLSGEVAFHDLSDPSTPGLGLTREDFFDAHHTTRSGSEKIMKYIMKNSDEKTGKSFSGNISAPTSQQ